MANFKEERELEMERQNREEDRERKRRDDGMKLKKAGAIRVEKKKEGGRDVTGFF